MYETTQAAVGKEHRKGRPQLYSRMVLLESMAHGWQVPLTSIKASVSALLADSRLEPSLRKDLLVVIAEKANHLNRLAGEALDSWDAEVRRQAPQKSNRPRKISGKSPWRLIGSGVTFISSSYAGRTDRPGRNLPHTIESCLGITDLRRRCKPQLLNALHRRLGQRHSAKRNLLLISAKAAFPAHSSGPFGNLLV